MKFYMNQNNGVVAVISEEHARIYGQAIKSGTDPIAAGVRVFTFCSRERLERSNLARMYFTGTHEDLKMLIEDGGHTMMDGPSDWDGYVPFSNLPETSGPEYTLNTEEAKYVCNLHDVLGVFGSDIVVDRDFLDLMASAL